MKLSAAFFLIFYAAFGQILPLQANDYSSFLSTNASLAVVIDHEYMEAHGENILMHFKKIFDDVVRENLPNGGINIKYFTWNAVRLKKDFLAAITITDCDNTWNFYKRALQTSVLLIAITDADCPRFPVNKALMIPMVDAGDEFSQIMLDIKVQRILKWKTATVLLDQNILDKNQKLIKSIVSESASNSVPSIPLTLYQIDDKLQGQRKRSALRQVLETYARLNHESKRQQFLVLSKFYEDIIEIGESLNMFHINNQWMFYVWEQQRGFDAQAVTLNLDEGANIAFALNETNANCKESLNCTIFEISKAFVTSISRMILEEQSIYGEISDEEWESIRFTKQEKQQEILSYMKEYLKQHSICSSCTRWRIETALTWGKTQEHHKYRAVTHQSKNKNFEFVNIGYWSPLLGFVCHELAFPHIEHHFRNITMNLITAHNPPWQILKKDHKGAIVEHSGIVMELLKELSKALNFSYYLHEAKNFDYDVYGQNINESDELVGSMTFEIPYPVIELLQGNQYFLAAVAATVDEPSRKPFNYTLPISVQKYSFIGRQPDEVSRIYLFTAPFTPETWASLVGAILLTAPILYAVNRLAPMKHLRISGLSTIKNCFWYVYGALLQQGGMYLPKADSGRLVVGIWWIVVIVLVTTYCGNLVAFLTFPKFQPGIEYLDQLIRHTEVVQYGLRNGTFFEKYAQMSTRKDFQHFMESALIYSNVQNEDIDGVKQGRRINIDWRINLQLIVQKQFELEKECKFALGREDFVDEQIALMVPKKSAYLSLINERIYRLLQMGFIKRWHQKNLPSMDKCNGRNILRQITNHKVNMEDMQGCFLVLLFGFIFAVFVIFAEFGYHRLYIRRKQLNQQTFVN